MSDLIDQLQLYLQQLEAVHGGHPDNEARIALQKLQDQLTKLEKAKNTSTTPEDGHAASSLSLHDDTTLIANDIENIEQRLTVLEKKIEDLPPQTQEILASAAGTYLMEHLPQRRADNEHKDSPNER